MGRHEWHDEWHGGGAGRRPCIAGVHDGRPARYINDMRVVIIKTNRTAATPRQLHHTASHAGRTPPRAENKKRRVA